MWHQGRTPLQSVAAAPPTPYQPQVQTLFLGRLLLMVAGQGVLKSLHNQVQTVVLVAVGMVLQEIRLLQLHFHQAQQDQGIHPQRPHRKEITVVLAVKVQALRLPTFMVGLVAAVVAVVLAQSVVMVEMVALMALGLVGQVEMVRRQT